MIVRGGLFIFLSVLAVGIAPFSGARGADALHASALMQYCRSTYDTDIGLCSGYIMAVAEMMQGGRSVMGRRACGHEGIKAQQLVDLVRVEAGNKPDLVHQGAGMMVVHILSTAFRCYDAPPASPDAVEAELLE